MHFIWFHEETVFHSLTSPVRPFTHSASNRVVSVALYVRVRIEIVCTCLYSTIVRDCFWRAMRTHHSSVWTLVLFSFTRLTNDLLTFFTVTATAPNITSIQKHGRRENESMQWFFHKRNATQSSVCRKQLMRMVFMPFLLFAEWVIFFWVKTVNWISFSSIFLVFSFAVNYFFVIKFFWRKSISVEKFNEKSRIKTKNTCAKIIIEKENEKIAIINRHETKWIKIIEI